MVVQCLIPKSVRYLYQSDWESKCIRLTAPYEVRKFTTQTPRKLLLISICHILQVACPFYVWGKVDAGFMGPECDTYHTINSKLLSLKCCTAVHQDGWQSYVLSWGIYHSHMMLLIRLMACHGALCHTPCHGAFIMSHDATYQIDGLSRGLVWHTPVCIVTCHRAHLGGTNQT